MKLPLVVVTWLDAWGDMTTPVELSEVGKSHKAEEVTTIGWVLRDDETGIQLSGEHCADGTYRSRSFIPRGMVQSVTPYQLVKPRVQKVKADAQG